MAESNRTQFAMRALSLADYFNAKIGDKRVSGYKVVLATPDGPSTAGGDPTAGMPSGIRNANFLTLAAL